MKVLGLDIGTISIGWGIVDERNHKIENCGVYIFPEGVKIEKGNTARGSFHKDTFYGCIMTHPERDLEGHKIFVQRVSCDTLSKDLADKIIDGGIRSAFINNLESGKQSLSTFQEKGILLPYQMNGKAVYVKRVRVMARPTSPIILK